MIETPADLWPIAVPQHLDLRVLSYARWPQGEDDSLPQIAGFILSSFNPLVAEVADRCLDRRSASVPGNAPGEPGTRTALLLASVGGDRATARAIADAVRTGRRVPPLLFFQSNPNAVLGHIAARRRLTGPVVGISPRMHVPFAGAPVPAVCEGRHHGAENSAGTGAGGIPADAFTEADWLLRDGDADEVLLIAAEQGGESGEGDRAEAVLVDRRL
jgi:hypothetical protein